MRLDVQYLSVPRRGETHNGDAVIVRRDGSRSLFALVDALGHGAVAQAVAEAAIGYLADCTLEHDVSRIMNGLHERLRDTRGACALVCRVDMAEPDVGTRTARITGCNVGNIELRSIGANIPVVATPGVLGGNLRPPRVFEGQLLPGQRIVAYSDGLSARMDLEPVSFRSGVEACLLLMEQYRRAHDDATVLVAELEEEKQ